MLLFCAHCKAKRLFNKAKRYSNLKRREFDLDLAIHYLKEALTLKPYEAEYHMKLEEVNELKSKFNLKFRMQVEDVFEIRTRGTVAWGRVQQGTIHTGDVVQVIGRGGEKRDTVVGLEMYHQTLPRAVPGDAVALVFRRLGKKDVQGGDVIERVEA